MSISVGDEFTSYEAFVHAKDDFERVNYVELCKEKSEVYPTADANLSQQLQYRRITFGCKYGVKRKASVSKGIRQVNSFKQGCPFRLTLNAKDGKLRVTDLRDEHSDHPRDANNFLHLPKRRRLDAKFKAEITTALQLKSNKKQLQDYIMQKTGQIVLIKDLHNLLASAKFKREGSRLSANSTCDSDLISVIDEMKNVPGVTIQAAVTENSELIGVFYQDQRMKWMLKSYPDIIIYDLGYKLDNYPLHILLLLVIDANGDSEVCCVWISTTTDSLDSFVGIFKEHNPSWEDVKLIVGEKDVDFQRNLFQKHFPAAHVDTCFFHVLKSFAKEITANKMRITEMERDYAIQLINDLAHAKSADKYDEIYAELRRTSLHDVIEYFDREWHGSRDHWTSYSRFGYLNQEVTMRKNDNKLECVNHRLKSALVRTRFKDLKQFFAHLMTAVQSMAVEMDHKALCSLQKIPVVIDAKQINEYRHYLTPFAYEKVRRQHKKSQLVNLGNGNERFAVSNCTCNCKFYVAMQLPCCHIFAYRKNANLVEFDAVICHQRWTKHYYNETRNEFGKTDFLMSSAVSKMNRCNQITTWTSKLSAILPDLSSEQFSFYLDKLKMFTECVENKKLFAIVTTGSKTEDVKTTSSSCDNKPKTFIICNASNINIS